MHHRGDGVQLDKIRSEHQPQQVQRRLSGFRPAGYLRDGILGAIDGCVTTFSIIAGSFGGQFPPVVIVTLGVANLLADGLSMAVSNYQGTMSEVERQAKMRKLEHRHCALIPREQREEIRQIYRGKGFAGALLERIVDVIMKNPEVCVTTVLNEEMGMVSHQPNPLFAALATFGAFVIVGSLPLLPFVLYRDSAVEPFIMSVVATAFVFVGIGIVKARLVAQPVVRSTLETLLMGGGAALVAYFIGALIRYLYNGAQAL